MAAWSAADEKEWQTRKKRIDPRLTALGWAFSKPTPPPAIGAWRTDEHPTTHGPADYALWLDGKIVGVVEAKKLTVGPQNVLTQAERYSRAIEPSAYDFDGFHAPFLYSTNGEVIWFRDARHKLNLSRRISNFHSASALAEMLGRDFDADCAKLLALPHDHGWLRPYQRDANAAVEKAIAERRRRMLVAMATGTGKTFTLVNQIYRLMKSGVAKRVLFLVDRRALAAQAVRAFSSFEAEPGTKFDQIYEVYSSRFHMEDFGEDEKFDPKVLPNKYLTDPQPGLAFVYVCTIQRMAMNILGKGAVLGGADEDLDDDVDKLDIPIHAFDAIIADECHRGYTAQEQSIWRSTLDHFDAIKIGLTATPAPHTTSYFEHVAFRYGYTQAVRDGYLVDYDVVSIRSDVRMNGVFLEAGEQVELIDPETGLSKLDELEDERQYATSELEDKVTSPDSNKKIVEEIKRYADAHQERYGRFPKTLIFADNDKPHTSHADQVVDVCRKTFNQGEAFVAKITGRVDRPLHRIREFRNRPNPGIAVTVDLLTTGVDIPDLEYIVFLRTVRSRILFEQMLGRGTRLGERHKDKSHFTVFDCFDGTLMRFFRDSVEMNAGPPEKPTRTLAEIIEDIWNNRDRAYNIRCLVHRIQRVDKQMSAEARDLFAAYVPDGDLAKYASKLPKALATNFVEEMKLLRDPAFQKLLVDYPRPERTFVKAYTVQDTVTSQWLVRDGLGREYKPEDYIAAFEKFVRENRTQVEAIGILLDRPRDWGVGALSALRDALKRSDFHFNEEILRKAHEFRYQRQLVDIISMVKHAADEQQPLLTAAERVERAFAKLTAGKAFTPEQQQWLDRIRQHLYANLSIDREDFEVMPVLEQAGGWGALLKAFGEQANDFLHQINEAVAA